MPTADEARAVRDRVAAAEAEVEDAKRARADLVLACLDDKPNWNVTSIADAFGLSRTAIYDIRDAGRLAP